MGMNWAFHVFLLLSSLVLCSCSTSLQLSCLAPSKVGLERGTTLVLNSSHATSLTKELTEELEKCDFYALSSSGEYTLELNDVQVNSTIPPHIAPDEAGIEDSETTFSAQIILRRNKDNWNLFCKQYSKETQGAFADTSALCRMITQDLCPHRLIYEESLNPPSQNVQFEQALAHCNNQQWENAAAVLENATAEPETLYFLGLIERQLGHFDKSTELFNMAFRQKNDQRYTLAAAVNEALKGAESQALKELKREAKDRDLALPVFRKPNDISLPDFFFAAILETVIPVPLPLNL